MDLRDPSFEKTMTQDLLALISAATVAVCVCIGVVMNLTTLYDQDFDNMGLRTFCMFTVNSNIFEGIAMLMALPYTIDGLRKGHYHLPNWCVNLMYSSTTAVALTFLVSLFILAPFKGFRLIFSGSRFFLHAVCPILAILTFIFFICDHFVTIKEIAWAIIPVVLYGLVYFVMVVVIGEERGGWNDFYGFATKVPLWVSLVVITPLTFGTAALLRLGHNKLCLRRRQQDAQLYRNALAYADIRSIVKYMARARRRESNTADIVVPARTIWHLVENSGEDMSLSEGCKIYLDTFLETGTVLEQVSNIEAHQV